MGTHAPRYSIILAAGEGTRMGSATHQKVCYPIDGQPAVNRAIKIYNKCGIEQHILVVGALASLDRDNAQQEEYLCEIVNQLATAIENGQPKYAVDYLVVQDPNHVLGFNTPTELFEVEALIHSEGKKRCWIRCLRHPHFKRSGIGPQPSKL